MHEASALSNKIAQRRRLMLLNIAFRTGYGAGGLLAPGMMVKLRLAPDTRDRPYARLFVRGFSAHQILVASLGIASRRWRGLEQPAAIAALAIDGSDMISAVLEAADRGGLERDLTGGLLFSAAGAVTAAAAVPVWRDPRRRRRGSVHESGAPLRWRRSVR